MDKYGSILMLGITLIFLSSLSSAHLDAGSDDVIDGYLIDFGYAPAHPVAGSSTILNFNLLDNSTQKLINVTAVFIRVSNGNNVVFAGNLKPNEGNLAMTYSFPAPGNYTLLARFYNGSVLLVENSYNMNVGGNGEFSSTLLYIIIGVLLIALSACCLRKKKKKKRGNINQYFIRFISRYLIHGIKSIP